MSSGTVLGRPALPPLAMPLVRKLLDFDDMTKALLRVLPETALATVPSLLAYKRTGVLSVCPRPPPSRLWVRVPGPVAALPILFVEGEG